MPPPRHLLLPSYLLSSLNALHLSFVSLSLLPRYLSLPPPTAPAFYECSRSTPTEAKLADAVHLSASLFALYLALDLLLLSRASPPPSTLLHHLLFLALTLLQLRSERSCLPFLWLALGELSTLFLNARWFLRACGGKRSRALDVLFALAFFGARVLGYGTGLFFFLRDDPNVLGRWELWQVTAPLLAAGYVLNLAWMRKIVGVALRPDEKVS
ncbi:hypothetical protein TeGR_g13128 [Tetraparma gracilis]|uniref:TLC domain-containing protein n=1 Tax=Tetraparma gracilis TaxID=2962635 RepID=A0ABQ6MXE8_9STRA|nr:hypothetical protein TeGR_g13128 [Tetraparma gracilis]